MKTNRILTIVAATVLLMTSCSNDDERMLTIINEDGTCSREMTFHPDQETVMAPLNEPIQSNGLHFGTDWERTWSVKGDSVRHACPMTQQQWDSLMNVWSKQDKPQTGLMHVKRQYQNVSEMSDSLTQAVRHLFKATASLDKHFKWFYTDYTYKETLAITNIEQIFPLLTGLRASPTSRKDSQGQNRKSYSMPLRPASAIGSVPARCPLYVISLLMCITTRSRIPLSAKSSFWP